MKICFWGNVANALKGKTDGGGELQIAFIARALAKCGHEVVVVDYATNEEFITPEGIKVFTVKDWNKGKKILRTVTHRIPGLYSTLKNQKADIYYCRIRDFRHIIAYWVARKVKGKFVIHMASDLDAMSFRERFKSFYMAKPATLWWFFSGLLIELVYPWLLRHADLVLVQHSGQRDVLLKKNIKPVILYNIIDMSAIPGPNGMQYEDFTYVGWLDKRKGFPFFYEIIKKLPNHTFKIIGAPRDKFGHHYYDKLKTFPNVRLMGELPHARTLKEISQSKALISTSPSEGFPNVFIEAWACGIPVYSLIVDPGSVIQKESLGVIAHGDIDKLARALNEFSCGSEFPSRALKYIEEHHAMNERKVNEINRIFTELRYGKIRLHKEAVLQAVDHRTGTGGYKGNDKDPEFQAGL
ncbi:MAG TPA: glycosyltransferase family 4 protein [Bacteroidales bacterium]|jgi:glycosyltransferase involved in cell wall biosynthesis|nr:glycosyltransferase family 4 protein [Bacteroidales bacterium]